MYDSIFVKIKKKQAKLIYDVSNQNISELCVEAVVVIAGRRM